MRLSILSIIALLLACTMSYAQQSPPARLKIFIDCSSTWCDMQHIKSEINVVDYLFDNSIADVHILITSQMTGSGGEEYDLIFFGRRHFSNQTDTIRFNTHPDATETEERDLLLHYIKAGLVPFITRTAAAKNIEINLKSADTTKTNLPDSMKIKDPWNDWVLRLGANLYANADANYDTKDYSGNFSANRITDKIKLGFGMYYGKSRSIYEYEENGETESFVVDNHNWSLYHQVVKSINPHWSWSYELRYSQNTFSNNKGRAYALAAAEYNIFPYKDVNHKLLTLSYGLTARRNHYYDTTIYNQTRENLFGHRATAYLSLNQKWGNTNAGVFYHGYFKDLNFFNLGIDIYTSVRVAGGLSFYVFAFGAITRDQLFLVKGDATPEEVLARRRQLASGYNYYTNIGLNYRFGSKTNNVVNPRFDRSGSPFQE